MQVLLANKFIKFDLKVILLNKIVVLRQKSFIKPGKIVNTALRFYNPRHLAAKLGSS
jgi:hypothetical protein